MKHINTRHRLHRATTVLALTLLVATGINSAKANGPTTLTSPPAAQANLVGRQPLNSAANEQNRKPTEAKSAPTAEASLAQGVNTAGTVRVNNFMWIEPVVNFLFNTGEVCGLLFGAYLIFTAFANNLPTKSKKVRRAILGISLMLLGVALPGTANWIFAGGRCGDVVLFN